MAFSINFLINIMSTTYNSQRTSLKKAAPRPRRSVTVGALRIERGWVSRPLSAPIAIYDTKKAGSCFPGFPTFSPAFPRCFFLLSQGFPHFPIFFFSNFLTAMNNIGYLFTALFIVWGRFFGETGKRWRSKSCGFFLVGKKVGKKRGNKKAGYFARLSLFTFSVRSVYIPSGRPVWFRKIVQVPPAYHEYANLLLWPRIPYSGL